MERVKKIKECFMKSTIKMIGIIAIAVIIGVSFLGCGPTEPEDKDLEGTLSINFNPDNILKIQYEGTSITQKVTASYSGSEEVSFVWEKAPVCSRYPYISAGMVVQPTAPKEITPVDDGWYKVTVKLDGYKSKSSDPFLAAGFADFIGTFRKDGVSGTGFPTYNEIADIYYDQIGVRDDYSSPLTPPAGKDDSAEWGHFNFYMTSWERLTSVPSGYTRGYQVNGSMDEVVEYNTVSDTTTSFRLYLKNDGVTLARTRGNDKDANYGIIRDLDKVVTP
jgi:hypothetical protein